MRKKYDTIGKVYNSGNGLEYSNLLYDWYTTDDTMLDSLPAKNTTVDTNTLTKICAVVGALDGGSVVERLVAAELGTERTIKDTNSNMLVYALNGNQTGILWY
ncbi:hypothetical protein ColLi_09265 [Colletotrichum liriopes]|uniref:Uncharacterized protein n=1 Tax=Colletotrichum liriopes TaxID=708192 RepID=A0AA37LVW9_9PEZI|nr:hypothetical protein ColLi_09265 [Colletotrichum liriopes]